MKGIKLQFKNRPNDDGTVSNLEIDDCLVAQSGSPTTRKPQIIIHLPRNNSDDVVGAWVNYDSSTYHVTGRTAASIQDNTPTRWNRYVIAEKIY